LSRQGLKGRPAFRVEVGHLDPVAAVVIVAGGEFVILVFFAKAEKSARPNPHGDRRLQEMQEIQHPF
jgi:hypothetical protein